MEAKKVADHADLYYIPIAPHNVASPIGTVACAHVCAAMNNFLVIEYHAHDVEWWSDLVLEGPPIVDGFIHFGDRPGHARSEGVTRTGASVAPRLISRGRDQLRRTAAVGVVLVAELRPQECLLGADARQQRRDQERREQHADARPKSQGPPQWVDEQPQIARMTDDTIRHEGPEPLRIKAA